MEMLVKMAAVLVKIAVMMMAPGGVPAPPEARGREPPFFFFFLDLLPFCLLHNHHSIPHIVLYPWLSPLPRHGSQGPEGKPFSHLGRRSRKKKKKGAPLPLASDGARVLPGPSSSPPSSPTTSPPSSPTLPPLYAAV